MTVHQFACVVDDCEWAHQVVDGTLPPPAPLVAPRIEELVALTEQELRDHLATHAVEEFVRTIVRLRQTATKPNPWFTKPAEFPLEAAEREDRLSVAYAFPTQEWRQEQLDRAQAEGASPFVPPAIAAIAEVRDRKREHFETVHRLVGDLVAQHSERLVPINEAWALANMENRDPALMLRRGEWHEADEDERTVRTEAGP